MIMGPRSVIMELWNVNRGPSNVIMRPCNVIMGLRRMVMGPWNVNRGPWNENK